MRVLFVSLVHVLMLAAQSTVDCNVVLRVVSYAGSAEPYRVASFRSEGGEEYSGRFAELRGNVPCSVRPYSVLVTRGIVGADVRGSVVVDRSEVYKTLVVSPFVLVQDGQIGNASYRLPPDYVFRGILSPAPAHPLWVVIRSLVGDALHESSVNDMGEFRMYRGFLLGRYILTVSDGSGNVVHSSILDIKKFAPVEPLVINLDNGPAMVTVR